MASCSLSEPGFDSGIVPRMRVKRSLAVRVRHVFMKLAPARGGASNVPSRLGKWQLAQVDWYAARPAAACSAVKGPGRAGCCGAAIAMEMASVPTTPHIANLKTFRSGIALST